MTVRQRKSYAEPYKIKMVEAIELKPEAHRRAAIRNAGYNIFNLRAEDVYIDLLTDSGTSAMSDKQWARIFTGDESYAGARSYYRFLDAVQDIFGYRYAVPAHQGRAAENIVMGVFVSAGQRVPGNMHFDTTEGHIRLRGATPVNLLRDEGYDTSLDLPFKGNIDTDKLEAELAAGAADRKVPFVMMTVTCNSNGGQPVSMENIRVASEITHRYGLPFFFDAARFSENCHFIKQREKGYADKSIPEIAKEMFSYGDGATMSCKKDALVNIGGFFAVKDRQDYYELAGQRQIQYEGFKTYGGLAGRDLEAIAEGLYEGMDDAYLEDRIGQVKYLGDLLLEIGVPLQLPVGGHGVFIDAKKLLPHVSQKDFPAQALTVALYEEGGVRGVELGNCAFGYKDPETGADIFPELELVRLAVPRRVYTDRHMDMTAEAMRRVVEKKDGIRGVKLLSAPEIMRHFSARFEPL
ncbi:MAG: tryptophanase [Clostridiales Family XIII bacterium]|jgi:tryptophanase|nr:tryptophanase [Clostridiales Family XIII bacterium]